jgi:hypothetical protein
LPDAVETPKPPAPARVIERPSTPGVRVFDDAAIRRSVDAALATLPPGKAGAVVAFVDTDKTVRLAVTARLGEKWSVVAKAEKAYHKPIKGEAEAVFAW